MDSHAKLNKHFGMNEVKKQKEKKATYYCQELL